MVDRAFPCSMLIMAAEATNVWHRPRTGRSTFALISPSDSFSIARVLKFLGKYREAGLLLLRASVGLIFILICAPVLLFGEHRWWQFGSAMRVFTFHSHLDWWGFLGALA